MDFSIVTFSLFLVLLFGFSSNEETVHLHLPEQIRILLSSDPSTEQIISWIVKSPSPNQFESLLTYTQLTNRALLAGFSNPSDKINLFTQNCSNPTSWQKLDQPESYYLNFFTCHLTGLIPDTAYSYSITGDVRKSATTSSKTYTFVTHPRNITPQVVGVVADMGTWAPADSLVSWISQIHDYDLFLHLGDMSYGLDEKTWNTWGNIVQDIAARVPYQTIPGNWDAKPAIVSSYKRRFSFPLLGDLSADSLNYYYSFKYSFATFIMLSAYDAYEAGSVQYLWLEDTLLEAQKDRLQRPWIIVCIHNPMYSSSSGHGGGDPNVRKALEKLFFENRVDLLLTGHDHGYERSYPTFDNQPLTDEFSFYQDPTGPIHVLAGVGGGTLDKWMEPAPSWSATRQTSHGLVKVSLQYQSLSLQFVSWPQKTIADQFTINKDIGKLREVLRTLGVRPATSDVILSPYTFFLLFIIIAGFILSVLATRRRSPKPPSFPL